MAPAHYYPSITKILRTIQELSTTTIITSYQCRKLTFAEIEQKNKGLEENAIKQQTCIEGLQAKQTQLTEKIVSISRFTVTEFQLIL